MADQLHDASVTRGKVEKTLADVGLFGICDETKPWAPELLRYLYRHVRQSTRDTFPPPGFTLTSRYAAISYVQTEYEKLDPPDGWCETVSAVLQQLEKEDGRRYGVWFDKMGKRQFDALQTYWGPIANLHYITHPVINVVPLFHQHYSQFRELTTCGLSQEAYEIVCEWIAHHEFCRQCAQTFCDQVNHMGFDFKVDMDMWVHPSAYYRCWPMVERSLALINCGLLSTEKAVRGMMSTCIALLGLLQTIDDMRSPRTEDTIRIFGDDTEDAPSRGYRVLNHHFLCCKHTCGIAKSLATRFPMAFVDTVRMMADNLAGDSTKIEVCDRGNDEKFSIAKKLLGFTAGKAAGFIPMCARDLSKRFQIERKGSDTVSVLPEIGRASCRER